MYKYMENVALINVTDGNWYWRSSIYNQMNEQWS